MITTTQQAKTDLEYVHLMKLLALAGKYVKATKTSFTNATTEFNRLDRECRHYDMDTTFLLSEAVDYFNRRPNSKYLQ